MEANGDNTRSPEQLLQGGEHFDDVDDHFRQQVVRQQSRLGKLPLDIPNEHVAHQALKRQIPVAFTAQNRNNRPFWHSHKN